MNWQKQPFSIRRFLEEREALLIHFSTWQSMHREFTFPEDLRLAKTLSGVTLAFSTIMAGDVGPYQADIHPEDANGHGSVGIVARILSDACVVAVGPSDHGTHLDIANQRVVLSGSSPDAFECARSIDVRRTWNDWRVRDFETVGLFVFEPAFAFRTMSEDVVIEVPVSMETIIAEFPADRIFSVRNGRFVEYHRGFSAWMSSTYWKIMFRSPGREHRSESNDSNSAARNDEVLVPVGNPIWLAVDRESDDAVV